MTCEGTEGVLLKTKPSVFFNYLPGKKSEKMKRERKKSEKMKRESEVIDKRDNRSFEFFFLPKV